MNRRQFFGMTAVAVAAAGLPALVLPEKTIFLPPRSGWWAPHLVLREVEQYTLNDDALWLRYDAAWLSLAGERIQVHCDFPISGLEALQASGELQKLKDFHAESARIALVKFKPFAGRSIDLLLPRTVHGRYV